MRTDEPGDNDTLEPLLAVLRRRWKIIMVCVLRPIGDRSVRGAADRVHRVRIDPFPGVWSRPGTVRLLRLPAQQRSAEPGGDQLGPRLAAAGRVADCRCVAPERFSGEFRHRRIGCGPGEHRSDQCDYPDPVLAARIANTYARQYLALSQEANAAQVSSAQALVQKELQALPPAERFGTVGQGLRTRANQLTELSALQTGNAEVVQPAVVPTSPSAPSTKRNAVIGGFIGLLLGFGLAFLVERFDRRIRDASELEEVYGVGVLGAVPFSRPLAMRRLQLRPGTASEAFGNLRARLRYFNVAHDVRSLLVTSALPHEGKTTTAINLAVAEALAGSTRTVLVEADLRQPTLERRLGLRAGPGLTEILTHNANLTAAIRRVPVDGVGSSNGTTAGFSVLAAGALPPNPINLLESRAMIDLLAVLSARFDLVILDAPPPSVVPDALPLMRLVRGVIIVARKNVTTRDAARQLRVQLSNLHVPLLGVVANGMSGESAGYGGYVDAGEHIDVAFTEMTLGPDLDLRPAQLDLRPTRLPEPSSHGGADPGRNLSYTASEEAHIEASDQSRPPPS